MAVTPEPEIAALLRQAGFDLPPATLAELATAHPLLRRMLARLAEVPPEAEAAVLFRPDPAPGSRA
jgi:hypothetical protein